MVEVHIKALPGPWSKKCTKSVQTFSVDANALRRLHSMKSVATAIVVSCRLHPASHSRGFVAPVSSRNQGSLGVAHRSGFRSGRLPNRLVAPASESTVGRDQQSGVAGCAMSQAMAKRAGVDDVSPAIESSASRMRNPKQSGFAPLNQAFRHPPVQRSSGTSTLGAFRDRVSAKAR